MNPKFTVQVWDCPDAEMAGREGGVRLLRFRECPKKPTKDVPSTRETRDLAVFLAALIAFNLREAYLFGLRARDRRFGVTRRDLTEFFRYDLEVNPLGFFTDDRPGRRKRRPRKQTSFENHRDQGGSTAGRKRQYTYYIFRDPRGLGHSYAQKPSDLIGWFACPIWTPSSGARSQIHGILL